jgi:hypothetical protein
MRCRWAWPRSSWTRCSTPSVSLGLPGVTLVLIEQFVHRALAFSDQCVILARGTVTWAGRSSDTGDEVLARYLGDEAAAEDAPAGT